MISYSGGVNRIPLTTAGFGTRTGNASRPTLYEEGPWVYKRNGMYYNVFAAECCSEFIGYSTASSPTGPWTYRGTIMPTQGGSFTNHAGIVDFNGGSYFFYHNGALPGGGGFTRSVAVEKFSYNANGTIPTINMTTAGAPQVGTLNPYVRQEAETIAWQSGVETERASEGGHERRLDRQRRLHQGEGRRVWSRRRHRSTPGSPRRPAAAGSKCGWTARPARWWAPAPCPEPAAGRRGRRSHARSAEPPGPGTCTCGSPAAAGRCST